MELVPLPHGSGPPLRWRQPAAFARRYELRGTSGLVAELEFVKNAGSLARARTALHEWQFERKGQAFSKPLVRDARGALLAEYRPNQFGNRGHLPLDGRSYELAATNQWNSDWQWLDPDGHGLLGFRFKSGIPNAAEVFVGEGEHPDLGLLITFGFYVLILDREDASALPGSITAARD